MTLSLHDVLGDAATGVLVGFTPTNTPLYLAWRAGLLVNIDSQREQCVPLLVQLAHRSIRRLNGKGASCILLVSPSVASAFADDARTLIVRLDELVEQHNEINAVIAAVGIVVITTNQDGFDDLGAMSLWTFLRKNIAFWTAPPLLLSMMRTLPFDLARQMMQIVVQSPEPAHATISHDQDMWHLLPWGAKARDAQRFALDDGAMLYIRHQLLVGQQG